MGSEVALTWAASSEDRSTAILSVAGGATRDFWAGLVAARDTGRVSWIYCSTLALFDDLFTFIAGLHYLM